MVWLIVIGLSVVLFRMYQKQKELKLDLKKYQPIIDLEKEITEKTKSSVLAKSQLEELEANLLKLTETIKILTEDHDLLSAGFYIPKYAFGDAIKYKEKLDSIREKQKNLIKNKEAIVCSTSWEVGGSKAEGKKMIDRIIKLGLSAFNVQCDNEILSVRFDNIDRSETKLEKIRENVDKLLEPNRCSIRSDFFNLKLEELYLAYEYEEQLHKEKEEQKTIREQAREEEKARREAERAEAEAEKEEKRFANALEKARQELGHKSESERELFNAKIAELESKLKAAREGKERAKSMGEFTKQGHVYIISNIGSFGEQVFKIGMTRRWEPMDRIWELSDASVPFDFDVHALVKSGDAPALEKKLHEHFNNSRVNRFNERKEFFRASIEEIALACKKYHGQDFKLTLLAEAKEYRQTAALKKT